jgi:hypothetical protein
MENNQYIPRSHLFTIRLWSEAQEGDRVENRGRVQYVLSGERRFFRDWSTLVEFLEAKLRELDGGEKP